MTVQTYSFPELRGRRARLRAPREADAPRLFALFSDPATMRWWPRAPMRSPGEAEGYLAECAGFLAGGDRIDWIVTTTRDDLAIGTCTLHGIDARGHAATVGYALLPAFRGRGIATDAVAQVIGWSRRSLGVARVEACVARGNEASRRVLERLGFVRAGPPDAGVDADADADGIERWVLDAAGDDQSRRSADSRYALPSVYRARRAR